MKKKKLWLSICSLALCVAASVVGMVAFAADSGKKPGNAFEYTETTPLKYNTYVSESGSARKGLLLYGYDNGATASFKGSLSGVFETEMKAGERLLLPSGGAGLITAKHKLKNQTE